VQKSSVTAAYDRMRRDSLAEVRSDGDWHVVSRGQDALLGDATQIRLEAALLRSVREVTARGISANEPRRVADAAQVNDKER